MTWRIVLDALLARLVPALLGALLATAADVGLLGPAPERAVEAAQFGLLSSRHPLPAPPLAR